MWFVIGFVGLYVDDNLMIGHTAAIDDAIRQFKENGLILKIICEITYLAKFNSQEMEVKLG